MAEKIILLTIFFIVMIIIGAYCRKKVNSVGDFVLGGRSVGPWLTAFAYGTSYFSAVVFIGYAGKFGWNFGISATWIGIGNALIGSLLAWVVLGSRTRRMTQRLSASTTPEFFQKRFDSAALKIVASIIIFVFLVPYSASVYTGLSYLFEMALGIPYVYCMIAMAVITALYLILGGYLATAINDFIQGIIMLVGIVLIMFFVLSRPEVGGLTNGLQLLEQIQPGNGTLFGNDPVNLIGLIILTSLGSWGLPQMIHKFYAVKDGKSIKRGAIISTVFALIVAGGSYFIGAFGRLFFPDGNMPVDPATGVANPDLIMPNMLQMALPSILIGVVIILVLSASMSTLSSLVLVSSSTLTLDFIRDIFIPGMDKKKQVLMIRCFCVLFVALSVIVALQKGAIITLMSYSWGALAGSFLAPFLYGLFWKKTTRAGVWAGFITAIGITLFGILVSLGFVSLPAALAAYATPPNFGALAMLIPLIVVPAVSLFTKKVDPKTVAFCFEKPAEQSAAASQIPGQSPDLSEMKK